jgi:hypothetical protein
MYLSFETGTEPELLLDAFPEPMLTRLRELKGRYDPDNVFNRNFPIPPLAARWGRFVCPPGTPPALPGGPQSKLRDAVVGAHDQKRTSGRQNRRSNVVRC